MSLRRNTTTTRRRASSGFSLVEMLLAIFILGIGVISISALFPAGIVMQRQSTDDLLGPVVAKNALGMLRARLTQSDFGGFQEFNSTQTPLQVQPIGAAAIRTIEGDWPWMRPSFLFDNPSTAFDEGAIDIFSSEFTRAQIGLPTSTFNLRASELFLGWPLASRVLWGIPYNTTKYPLYGRVLANGPAAAGTNVLAQRLIEPDVMITSRERYWPQGSEIGPNGTIAQRPQYVWECMFRRYGGKVQACIFVYRVQAPGGEAKQYSVAPAEINSAFPPNMILTPFTPPLPMFYAAPAAAGGQTWPDSLATPVVPADEIPNTQGGTTGFAPLSDTWTFDDWQSPGQLWVDNNAIIHKVLVGRKTQYEGRVKLTRPIARSIDAPINGVQPNAVAPAAGFWPSRCIGGIWFLPGRDANGNQLIPVYLTVEEL